MPRRALSGAVVVPAGPLSIAPLQQGAVDEAARLLARSMRDNPLHRRVFGSDEARLEPLLAAAFARLLGRQLRVGCVLAAREGDRLVGVAAMVPPGHCRPPLREAGALLAVLARGRALHRLPRIGRWLCTWARHDPRSAHWHMGPAAVDRAHQGRGVGTALMAALCERLDRLQGVGYLETDKPGNVRLYRRGGFEVVARRRVLGVDNWFMQRRPSGPVPDPHSIAGLRSGDSVDRSTPDSIATMRSSTRARRSASTGILSWSSGRR